jgi:hypothetical protein
MTCHALGVRCCVSIGMHIIYYKATKPTVCFENSPYHAYCVTGESSVYLINFITESLKNSECFMFLSHQTNISFIDKYLIINEFYFARVGEYRRIHRAIFIRTIPTEGGIIRFEREFFKNDIAPSVKNSK